MKLQTTNGAFAKFDQAILVTRNNPWLVRCTNEMATALATCGVRIALIAYTGASPGWLNGKEVPSQLRPFRNWVDGYFDTTYTPWVEQKTRSAHPGDQSYRSYLGEPGYFTLNQLAHKCGLFSAIRLDLGDKGRAEYHKAVTQVVASSNPARTLAISVDTRLLIDKETLTLVPHDGFHPGRMFAHASASEALKALDSDAPLKMIMAGERNLHGAAHRLGGKVDSGGVIAQYTLSVEPASQSMFAVYGQIYSGLVHSYINRLGHILDPHRQLVIRPQGEGSKYPELTDGSLAAFLAGWPDSQWQPKDSNAPHGRLVQAGEYLVELERFLPVGIPVCEMPAPPAGITAEILDQFVNGREPVTRASLCYRPEVNYNAPDLECYLVGLS